MMDGSNWQQTPIRRTSLTDTGTGYMLLLNFLLVHFFGCLIRLFQLLRLYIVE